MAFKGTLDSLGMVEIMQLICMTQKTGCLMVAHPKGEAKHLYFEGGDITAATSTAAKDRLGFVLVKMGMLTVEQLAHARADEQRTGVKQGASLVERGLLTEEQLDTALTRQIAEIFFGLMVWHEGSFEFLDDLKPSADVFRVPQSVTNLIMQGTRQLDEWGLIEKVFPSQELVLSLAPHRERSGPISLEDDEWQILTAIDGKRTIREVCAMSSSSNFEVCKKLLNLHHAGLVMVNTVVAPPPAPPVQTPPKPPPTKKVPSGFLPAVRTELTRHVGPIANILLDEVSETLGVPLEQLPVTRVNELVKALCDEIDSPDKREHFREIALNAARS